jgi:hypothetical protein
VLLHGAFLAAPAACWGPCTHEARACFTARGNTYRTGDTVQHPWPITSFAVHIPTTPLAAGGNILPSGARTVVLRLRKWMAGVNARDERQSTRGANARDNDVSPIPSVFKSLSLFACTTDSRRCHHVGQTSVAVDQEIPRDERLPFHGRVARVHPCAASHRP